MISSFMTKILRQFLLRLSLEKSLKRFPLSVEDSVLTTAWLDPLNLLLVLLVQLFFQ